jgi:hypothetical protein
MENLYEPNAMYEDTGALNDYRREELALEDEFRRLGDDEAPRWGSI